MTKTKDIEHSGYAAEIQPGVDFPVTGKMLAVPQIGCRVRKPANGSEGGGLLPDEGEAVNIDDNRSYWLRRINAGDVIVCPISNGDEA